MLFHLFSQHANGYLTFPAAGGPYSISNRPGVGTVIDLCNSNGQTIERGLYYNDARNGPGFSDTRGDEFGHDTLEHNDIVTMAHPSGRFITPRGSALTLEAVQPSSAQFQIKKWAARRAGGSGMATRSRWAPCNPITRSGDRTRNSVDGCRPIRPTTIRRPIRSSWAVSA